MAKEYINKPPVDTRSIQNQENINSFWVEWFNNIERILGRSNNEQASFTPVFSGLTGTGTYTGSYYRFNTMLFFEVTISTTTTTASTAGTTYISNLPFISSRNGSCIINDSTTKISIGTGLVEENNSSTTKGQVKGYLPTWGATSDSISISGSYRIKI